MRFSSLIIKNLLRRPARSLLTLIALATAIASIVGLLGVSSGFTKSFSDIYAAHSVDIVVSRQGYADRLSSSVSDDFIDSISQLGEVERAAGVLLDTLSLEEQGVYGVPTMGIDPSSWMMDSYQIKGQIDFQGSRNDVYNASDKSPPKVAYLGVHLSERLSTKPGESISLFDEDYLVVGIFQSPSTWENGSMILPVATLQELTAREGQVTYINVVLKKTLSGDAAATTIKQIGELDAKLLAQTTSEFVETDARMQLAGAMAWMTSAIALVIGSIGTLNTMLTSVMERTSEIGILRAIGWPRRRIVGMILCESCGLAIVASLLGCLLAVVMTWTLSQSPAAKGILSPTIEFSVMLEGLALAVAIGLLGAILPAIRAARMLPTEAFRANA